jgi:hypothetical protein
MADHAGPARRRIDAGPPETGAIDPKPTGDRMTRIPSTGPVRD